MDTLLATLFWGYFLSYIGMGFYQPMNALYRLTISAHQNGAYRNGLKKYLLLVSTYFGIIYMAGYVEYNQDWIPLYLFAVPHAFLIWYIIYTKKWDKKLENIRTYDRIKLLEAPHPDRLELEAWPHKVVQIVKLKSQLKLKIN